MYMYTYIYHHTRYQQLKFYKYVTYVPTTLVRHLYIKPINNIFKRHSTI